MMKKLLFLILLFLATVCYAGFSVDGVTDPASVDGVATPASVDGVTSDYVSCPDCFLWITFDASDCSSPLTSYTLDNGNTELADGDTTLSFNSAAQITSGAALDGNCGLDIQGASDYVSLDLTTGVNANKFRCGMKLYFNTFADNGHILQFYEDGSNNALLFIDTSPTNEYRTYFQENDGTPTTGYVISSGGEAGTGVEVFVEYILDATQTNGSDVMNVKKNGSSIASSSSISIDNSLVAANIRIGSSTAVGIDYFIDTFVCTSDLTFDLYDLVVTQGITEYPGS